MKMKSYPAERDRYGFVTVYLPNGIYTVPRKKSEWDNGKGVLMGNRFPNFPQFSLTPQVYLEGLSNCNAWVTWDVIQAMGIPPVFFKDFELSISDLIRDKET